jgi:pantoate--beta-alanine ligase
VRVVFIKAEVFVAVVVRSDIVDLDSMVDWLVGIFELCSIPVNVDSVRWIVPNEGMLYDVLATVVAKLFNIIKPHYAVFGQKDFQQLAVIQKMTRELDWDIEIVAHPIVREGDGLAMSSRNTYLSDAERLKALCLYRAILHADARFTGGLTDAELLKSEIHDIIAENEGIEVDYIAVVDKENLADRKSLDTECVLALAVKVGRTRLIDNFRFGSNI